MGGDKEAAMMALRRELEGKLDQLQSQSESKIDRLSADLMSQSQEASRMKESKDATINELHSKVERLQREMSEVLVPTNTTNTTT